MANKDDTLWTFRTGRHPDLAASLDAMRLDRGIDRSDMARTVLAWAINQKQRDCEHSTGRRVDDRCGECGKTVIDRPIPDF